MKGVDSTSFIHPTVEIEPGAAVGPRTKVWWQAHIRSGAVIGADTQLGANVFIDAGVHVGDRVKIQNNVSVYTGVELEDGAFVGSAAVFTTTSTRAPAIGKLARHTFVVTSVERRSCAVSSLASTAWSLPALPPCAASRHIIVLGNPAFPRMGMSVWSSRDKLRPSDLVCDVCLHGDT
jgi:acyl-[acyl carrier protein]--UDP-N-acetylglucosamine O-acyltransferase